MQLALQEGLIPSWHKDNCASVFEEIFSPSTAIAIWSRSSITPVENYFQQIATSLGLGVRGVFNIASLRDELHRTLPNGCGKSDAIDDIFLLSDMLTCLFDCQEVGLRLVPLNKAMCPRFHVDNIPVRLICTYLGPGTQWLPNEAIGQQQSTSMQALKVASQAQRFYAQEDVQQMTAFDVGLLKGQAWENHEHMAAIHRSCAVDSSSQRVLLSLDPL